MERLEKVIGEEKPAALVVVGDVNSTLAGALVAAKLHIPVAHVEAGLRSYNREMPEEINRIVTDQLSRWLFTPSPEAEGNLQKEGVIGAVHFVGNVMIDTLTRFLPLTERSQVLTKQRLTPRDFVLVTLHRPSNVDDGARLEQILRALAKIAEATEVVFPVHPRTRRRMETAGLTKITDRATRLRLLPPLGYLDFLMLMKSCSVALTDSGGIQEETTILKVPCLTFRPQTERPVTVTMGTNRVLGTDPATIVPAVTEILGAPPEPPAEPPPLWDGKAASRIVRILAGDLAATPTA